MKPIHRMTVQTSGIPGDESIDIFGDDWRALRYSHRWKSVRPYVEDIANADSVSVSDELRVRPSEGEKFQIPDYTDFRGFDESTPGRGWMDFSVLDGVRPNYGICTSTLPSEAGSGERTPKIFWTGTVIPQSGFSRFLIKLGFWFDGVIWEGANHRSDGEGGGL